MSQSSSFNFSTLQVADIDLPREVEPLYELAYNLWWTWSPEARELFASIDSRTWARYRNPVQLLINVKRRQWYALLEDEHFVERYSSVLRAFESYMRPAEPTWFERHHGSGLSRPVAYFSMEFGLHESLAIYSGGLGVLSGDHCKSASDLGVPMVSVGLLYRHGYFQQTIDAEGFQQHAYPDYDFSRLPLRPLATASGGERIIEVPLPGRGLAVKLWLAQVGRVPLILLDTDLPENDPADRPITGILYVRGRESRLAQELVLGIGGVKALRELGLEPEVWHLNEGHSVFLQTERLRESVAAGLDLADARRRLRRSSVFTTHTPVAAGNEQFEPPLIERYLSSWSDEVGMPLSELQALGRGQVGEGTFNLTALALRTSSFANGVSKLNAEVASSMWRHLIEAGESPAIEPITNGIHTLTWIGPEVRKLLRRELGAGWESMLLSPEGWEKVLGLAAAEVWAAHQAQKERLGRFTRTRLRRQLARHGASPDELRAVSGFFDPRALTLGFARRFATYKRASLIFSDVERLRRLLADVDRPVQILFAGKAHPADRPGQELVQSIFQLSRDPAFIGKVFFLEGYDMRMGRMLTQGVDVWLNTPRRPLEASGTSGQKAAANGSLNFSILDGWWPEGYAGKGGNGWSIESPAGAAHEVAQDLADAESFYETLESQLVPLFYGRDEAGLPHEWIARMRASIAGLTPRFSASRMVADYVERAYLPAALRARQERD